MEITMEMYEYLNMMEYALGTVGSVIMLAVAAIGIIEAFFGFRIMKACYAICGFAGGAVIFGAAAGLVSGGEAAAFALGGLVGGIIGALMLYRIHILGVFLTNTMLSGIFLFIIFGVVMRMGASSIAVALVGGAIVGIISCKFVRIWTIVATGLAGALLAGEAILIAFHNYDPVCGILIGIVIAVMGIRYQFNPEVFKQKKAARAEKSAAGTGRFANVRMAVNDKMAVAKNKVLPTTKAPADSSEITLTERKIAYYMAEKKSFKMPAKADIRLPKIDMSVIQAKLPKRAGSL